MLMSSMFIGVFIGMALFNSNSSSNPIIGVDSYETEDTEDADVHKDNVSASKNNDHQLQQQHHSKLGMKAWIISILTHSMLLLIIALGVSITCPNENYTTPFLTGCDAMCSTDIVDDEDSTCCQMCTPKKISKTVTCYDLIFKFINYDFDSGMCEDIGYEEHAVDKTFKYFSYVLDVEVYYPV